MTKPQLHLPCGFMPRAYQIPPMKYFDQGGKRGVWCVHRRGGKDRTMLAQISKMAFRRVGLYWHLLPTLKQARKAVWDNITGDGKPLMATTFPAPLVKAKREDEMKLTLINGSIVQLIGGDNFDSWVGANPVHVTFSEFALTHPKAWDLARPILAENGGTAAFISTPRGYNHFHKLLEYAKADPEWYGATMDVLYTGRMTKAQVDAEIRSGMHEALARQEFYCDFSAANVGAILGDALERADREGRVSNAVRFDEESPGIEVVLDIGYNDATAMWCWQRRPDGVACLGYDEDTGHSAEDWIARMARSGYTPETVACLWLPHDARARTFASGTSVMEQFMRAKYKVAIVPHLSKHDQINAARALIKLTYFNRDATEAGRNVLRSWQFKYDEEKRTFSDLPEHNWASHGGDAFAYSGVVMKSAPPPEKKTPAPYAVQATHSFALDDLWKTAASSQRY